MFETLFFYVLIAVIICYFFRKHCQDPKIIKAGEAAEKQEEEEEKKQWYKIEMGIPVRAADEDNVVKADSHLDLETVTKDSKKK